MVVKKILGILAIIGLLILSGQLLSHWLEIKCFFVSGKNTELVEAKKESIQVDGSVLLEKFEATQQYQSTPEEIAEDAAFEAGQIADARQWLSDPEPEQRIVGAEQLSAYPTPETQQSLAEALAKDPVDEVKLAAANSLAANKSPSLKTREALVAALQVANEDVRNAALSTLQIYLAADSESPAAKKTLGMLKKQLKSKRVPADIREAIKDYLLDQFPEK